MRLGKNTAQPANVRAQRVRCRGLHPLSKMPAFLRGVSDPSDTPGAPGGAAGGAQMRIQSYLMVMASTSSRSLAAKSAQDMAPRSSPVRWRGETVPFSMSRSPTTSI